VYSGLIPLVTRSVDTILPYINKYARCTGIFQRRCSGVWRFPVLLYSLHGALSKR